MDTTIYYSLLHQIRTTTELDTFSQCVDEILRDVYYLSHESVTSLLTTRLRPEVYHTLVTTLQAHQISIKDQEAFKTFFITLRTLLTSSPILTVNIAYTPSDSSITSLSAKAKELFGESTILEINVFENLSSGAVIIYKGRYLDLSFTHRLDEVFKLHLSEFQQILDSSKGVS